MARSSTSQPQPPNAVRAATLAYSAVELADALGISQRHLWRLHDAGRLPAAVRLGRRVVWPRQLIDEWLAAGGSRRPNS
ncbi:MAG: helix-turn-helix domain-containing protein [Gemmataceae bacterium]